MNDEPRRILRGLCNDAAMIAHTMLVRGYTDEEIAIMCRVYAEHRMKASRRIAAVPGPEWGWKDGRWVALDHGAARAGRRGSSRSHAGPPARSRSTRPR
jgi:hypothetical protein